LVCILCSPCAITKIPHKRQPSSERHDNQASLGVSRAIGYADNGVSTAVRGNRLDTMVHLRMTAGDWEATGAGDDVLVEGFEPCQPFFGLGVE
jgi:hypothetical protein